MVKLALTIDISCLAQNGRNQTLSLSCNVLAWGGIWAVIYFRIVSEATPNYFKLMGITYFNDRFKVDYSAAG